MKIFNKYKLKDDALNAEEKTAAKENNDSGRIEDVWELEYKMLQSQINPHFLYNTLDSIRSEALKSGETVIAGMVEKLSRFFRYSISSTGNFVKLSEELNHINDYYYIQKFRFEDRLSLEVKVISTDTLDCYIPKMTLQPILENAITHGLENKLTPGKIEIVISETEKKVYININDDGVGIPKEHLKIINDRLSSSELYFEKRSEKGGLALLNVNARLKLTFGQNYGIHVSSAVNVGTQMEIIIPRVTDKNLSAYDSGSGRI